ncbi:MAG: PA14 domain-containing protein [Rudaea sp.]
MSRQLVLLSLLALALVSLSITAASPQVARAQSAAAFSGEYYDNPTLSGAALFTREDPDIRFDWSASPPDPRLKPGGYSARWTRWYRFDNPGAYLFSLSSTGGSRLWLDGNLAIDLWYDHAPVSRAVQLDVTQGYHLLRVEYYDHGQPAKLEFTLSPASVYPDWKGEYFFNQELKGEPAITRDDPEINFNWGEESPDPALPADHFSVRWTRNQAFAQGNYRFSARTDDGVRVWIGERLIIDQWASHPAATATADVALAEGVYPLKVEYYEETGSALAIVGWAPVTAANAWTGQYFNNANANGTPALSRSDADLNFNWGTAGPGKGISGSVFSARWDSARTAPSSGFYTVYATADDGVRVSLDGKSLVDEWHDSAPTTYAATVYLTAGVHNWHVEYYQHLGGAMLAIQFVQGVAAQPPLTSTEIVVENGSSGWLAGGEAANWKTVDNDRGGKAAQARNSTFVMPQNASGRWYPSLPDNRLYEVSVYIPANVGSTHSAHYLIAHGGTVESRVVAQALYSNQWVSLGSFYFDGTGGEYVSLSNVTYECNLCYTVAWDAVKFIPR